MEKATLNMEEMATAVLRSFPREFIELTTQEQSVSVQLYRLLAGGQPVPRERLARAANLPEDTVNSILNKWPGVFSDQKGRIIGYWGLALPEMAHHFGVDGQTLYTWCAWDSLFIPGIIRKTGRVESTCPVTGDTIRLTVTPEGVTQREPAGAVMSFMTPEAARVRENVILNFCHYVHFFSSAEAGAQWVSQNPGTFLLSLDDAYYLARKKNEVQYMDTLGG